MTDEDKTWEEIGPKGQRVIHVDPNRVRAFVEWEAYGIVATDEAFEGLVASMAERFGDSDADYDAGKDAEDEGDGDAQDD